MGQTSRTIDSLERHYQQCLDQGANMLGCSRLFYHQMDSMMNVVYRLLHKKMSASEFTQLKAEQIKWLSKRDKYFRNVPLDSEENALGPGDKEMVIVDRQGEFVKDRVLVLLKKLDGNY